MTKNSCKKLLNYIIELKHIYLEEYFHNKIIVKIIQGLPLKVEKVSFDFLGWCGKMGTLDGKIM